MAMMAGHFKFVRRKPWALSLLLLVLVALGPMPARATEQVVANGTITDSPLSDPSIGTSAATAATNRVSIVFPGEGGVARGDFRNEIPKFPLGNVLLAALGAAGAAGGAIGDQVANAASLGQAGSLPSSGSSAPTQAEKDLKTCTSTFVLSGEVEGNFNPGPKTFVGQARVLLSIGTDIHCAVTIKGVNDGTMKDTPIVTNPHWSAKFTDDATITGQIDSTDGSSKPISFRLIVSPAGAPASPAGGQPNTSGAGTAGGASPPANPTLGAVGQAYTDLLAGHVDDAPAVTQMIKDFGESNPLELDRVLAQSADVMRDLERFVPRSRAGTPLVARVREVVYLATYGALERSNGTPLFPAVNAALPLIARMAPRALDDPAMAGSLELLVNILYRVDAKTAQEAGSR